MIARQRLSYQRGIVHKVPIEVGVIPPAVPELEAVATTDCHPVGQFVRAGLRQIGPVALSIERPFVGVDMKVMNPATDKYCPVEATNVN